MSEAAALEVDPTNIEHAQAWDGDEGAYWASHAEHFDRALGAYHARFMAATGIEAGERVLDIGCGTGQTTRHAARAARGGSAMGVDLSARMVEVARRLAEEEDLVGASFEQADVQIHPFPTGAFDVAISRTGTMFFGDPAAAFANVARAVRSGGRLALLVWRGPEHNEWIRELTGVMAAGRDLPSPPIGAPGPFAQSDPEVVEAVLSASGFRGIGLEGLSGPMWFGTDADDAHAFVLGLMGWMLAGLEEPDRERAVENLLGTLQSHASAQGVTFASATWLVTATRS